MTNFTLNNVDNRAQVSVIIPCYRCSDTIGRAVDSVMEQTLLPQEIILIDDYSNDTQETINTLIKLSNKIHDICIKVIFLKENVGPGSARNAGWSIASQPYIAFLDSDDSWHPRKIQIQYEWMERHPEIVLSGHLSHVMDKFDKFPKLPNQIIVHQINKNLLLIKNCIPTRSVMIKRDIPFKFVPGKRYSEDYLLWLTIFLNGYQVRLLEMPLAYSYKAEFGAGGLTGNLWESQKGEIDTYIRLFKLKLISKKMLVGVSVLSIIKYLRRCAIVKLIFVAKIYKISK